MGMKKICFLIDDDEDDQDIFKIAVKRSNLNIECITASGGFEALKLLNNDPNFKPDYIFLDLNMPGMDGRQTLKEIKKLQHLPDSKVIMYSTSSYEGDIKETKNMGAHAFVSKPSNVADLVKILTVTIL